MQILQKFHLTALLQLEASDDWRNPCAMCDGRLNPGDIVFHSGLGEYMHDGCITTLAIKIATIRRRAAGIPPVGRRTADCSSIRERCKGGIGCTCEKVGCWAER